MKERVLIGMSGGLDSSVAAALLVEHGYDVIGVTIKTYRYEDVGGNVASETSCCSLDGINDARHVAATLGIPHYVFDFSDVFEREIIDYFTSEYLGGRTPNPCVLCNRRIKWAEMLGRADSLGARFIATGHYARLRRADTGRLVLSRGRDAAKDQSYALWGLAQASLERTLFPLGEHTKGEVRQMAEERGLSVAGKRESYEICFIPDNDYRRFLRERVPGLGERLQGGSIVRDGAVIGHHEGYPFYTVGQRRGLAVSAPEPLYVIGTSANGNVIEVGTSDALFHRGLRAHTVNLISVTELEESRPYLVRIRYQDAGTSARCRIVGSQLEVMFDEPRRAIAPGQSVVLYDGDDVVGGGIISEWFDPAE